MIRKIHDFIEQYSMLSGCDHIVVGLSGGADSVCLLRVLKDIIESMSSDIRLIAVHINHGIRGGEAERDELFARDLCSRLNVEFISRHVNVPELARIEGVSEEEAGRRARYAAFSELTGDTGRIAVAHHMDDEAETVLMNMFRGSGIKGMGGMAPVRDNIIRPLLCVTRQEIETYLGDIGQSYVVDSTNLENIYTRNRVRNELIPYIKDNINPKAVQHIVVAAEYMRESQAYIDERVDEFISQHVKSKWDGDFGCCEIPVEVLGNTAPVISKGVVVRLLRQLSGCSRDWYSVHVKNIVELAGMHVGKSLDLPYGLKARRDYDRVVLSVMGSQDLEGESSDLCDYRVEVLVDALKERVSETKKEVRHEVYVRKMAYDGERLRMLDRIVFTVSAKTDEQNKSIDKKNIYTKFFDCDKIKSNLVLRCRQDGDVIVVEADGRTRKLKKEFIDRKIPLRMRGSIMLLAQENRVLWAAGVRRCQDYLVEDCTKDILRVELIFQEEE